MKQKRTTGVRLTVGVAVLLLLLGAPAVYGGLYILRSTVQDVPPMLGDRPLRARSYQTESEARIFKPAANIESLITGTDIMLFWDGGLVGGLVE
jgi:hypothetical protein